MSGHTPGPWRVEDPLGPGILSIVAGGEEPSEWIDIAQVPLEEIDITLQESAANAALLAAAPELADALEELFLWITAYERGENKEEAAEITIARVERSRAALRKSGRLP